MARNIVICCDSFQDVLARDASNVVKLYASLSLDDSSRQVAYYRPGLRPGSSGLGLALAVYRGSGVAEALIDSYTYLMDTFEPGDRAFLFGSGPGGYVVRALASMLHLVGLLRKGNNSLVPALVQLLQSPEPAAFEAAGRFRSAFPQPCSPYFVGVWDTSRQAGFFSSPIHPPYSAHNPGITIGRHAISIDERRSFYRAGLWRVSDPGQDIKQVWFAGVHSDVTGGYPEEECGLSKITLEWMLREAELAGLLLDQKKTRTELGYDEGGRSRPDASAPMHRSLFGVGWLFEFLPTRVWSVSGDRAGYVWRIPGGARRKIREGSLLHESAAQRATGDSAYRPPNLPAQFTVEPWVRWEPQRARDAASAAATASRTFPATLLNDLRVGQCVLYAGAGVSATAGLPVWREFSSQLLDAAASAGSVPRDQVEQFQSALATAKADYVVDGIVSRTSPSFLESFLRSTFQGMREVPSAYRELSTLPFAAALTTNFDNLLERAFNFPPDKVRTPRDVEALYASLKKNEFFLLHLYGTLERPDTMLVSPAQFEASVSGNLPFRDLIENLFVTRTILFCGCSLEGIETYLRGLRFKGRPSRTHFAIAGVAGNGWQVMAGVLRDRYGIEVIPYQDGSTDALEETVSALRNEVTAGVTPHTEEASAPLKRLILQNIGAFPTLSFQPGAGRTAGAQRPLKLQPDFNIFLGGNGVGKSTILRAIAAVLCGRAAEASAAQMLRVQDGFAPAVPDRTGSIELDFGRSTYKTTIAGTNSGREVTSPLVIPVAAEQVLAFGFPPLRTASPAKSNTAAPVSEPVAEDLLPLVRGEPDFRLNALRGWIIRLDHQAKEEETNGLPPRSQQLLKKLFDAIGILTEGVRIELAKVVARTEQILVRTDDGEVPLELVSQGTASLISWIGVILQRLYEVYPSDPDPARRHFLVLMDEIDAHMHPSWQRILLNRLRDLFPNMQLLATTHSPLIIADLPWDRVFHVARQRDEETGALGPVEVRQYEMKLEKLESSQILLSPLFGLDYSQGEAVEKAHKEYAELRRLEKRDDRQQERLDELARQLFGRDAKTVETVAGAAYAAVERSIEKEIEEKPLEEQQKLIERAQAALRIRIGKGGPL